MALAALLAPTESPAGAQPQQSFWELVVNEVPHGTIVAVLDGDRVWLPVAAIEKAGLRGFAGRRETMFGEPHVLLRSLEPGITVTLDTVNVVMRVTADARYFAETHVTLQRPRPAGIQYSNSTSAFLNYSATWDYSAGTSGFGEAGLALFGNTSAVSGFSVDSDGRVIRGLSTLTVDWPSARRRLQLGDIVVAAPPLGSGPTVAGVAFGRDYSVDPYYFRYPSPFIRGTAASPSDVEIYVNGAMVRRMAIPPGPYRFDRLPLNTGLGDVKVVVRDRLGREQTYASSVYLASGVLRRGDQDYRYVAGVERDDSGTTPVYGTAGAEAYHRIGFTDWLTAGYSAEGSRAVAAGGPNLAMRLGRLGEINVEAWGSRTEDGTRGAALYGLYAFTSANLNVNATAQYYDSRFANLSMAPDTASTPEFYQASASVPMFGAGSLTYSWDARRTSAGSYGFTTPDGAFDATLVRAAAHSLRGSARLFPGAQLTATATMTLVRGERQWSGFAGFNVALSAATTASVTYSSMPGIESTYADVDRSLPVGVGYGYRLTASDADGGSGSGQFEVNLPFTHVRLNYDAQKDREANGAGTIAGSLIVNRGGLFLTRELDASAAVVEVTGLPRVRVLADNVPIGRTNRHGRLLIPDLLPYLGNRISFDESDIPFDYSVPVLSQLVAPPFRGAAYVKFDTARIHARTGSIRMTIDGTDVTPAYGVIVVALGTGEVQSPLNADGEFFLDLPDGRHTATVTFKGRSCAVTIDAVPITGLAQKLGTLRCAP